MPFVTYRTAAEQKEMISAYLEGASQADLARKYGISRQRVNQILTREGVAKAGGHYRRRAVKAQAYQTKWGEREDTPLYNACRAKYRSKKAQAKAHGIEFSIQFGEIVWPDLCPVFGVPLNYFSDGVSEFSPSFDRIDPTKGYISGNVLIISWRANRIKNDATAQELQKLAEFYLNLTKPETTT